MKKHLSILLIFLTMFSCKVRETPEFVSVDSIHVKHSDVRTITLSANANFKNPNDIGGTLESDGISVMVNDIELGSLKSEAFDVPAQEEFSIPLEVTLSTEDIVKKDKGGLIGGLLNSILSKSIKVQYKGNITYKALGFSYDYPLDIVQDVKIKL